MKIMIHKMMITNSIIDLLKNIPTELKKTSYLIGDILRGMLFPKIAFNYMTPRNEDRKIAIEAQR